MTFECGVPYHNKSIAQCRAVGRIGGLRSARNRRLRRLTEAPVHSDADAGTGRETARQAIERIDRAVPLVDRRRTTRQATANGVNCLNPYVLARDRRAPLKPLTARASNLGCSRRMPWNKTL